MLFLSAWLVGWFFGEMSAIEQLTSESMDGGGNAFLYFWLAAWTAGGVFAFGSVVWMAFGMERVLLTTTTLKVRREALGVGLSKEYALSQIENLRVSPNALSMSAQAHRMRGMRPGGGSIAFEYGAATVRFCAGVDEAEANSIVEDLRSRHAFGSST
ncbi:MAG: hypothetical protein QF570_15660 [Myxococcota bacterium]|nr:hypothetical protein [Myxococcota bacterium]